MDFLALKMSKEINNRKKGGKGFNQRNPMVTMSNKIVVAFPSASPPPSSNSLLAFQSVQRVVSQ